VRSLESAVTLTDLWKEVAVAQFEVISHNLTVKTGKAREISVNIAMGAVHSIAAFGSAQPRRGTERWLASSDTCMMTELAFECSDYSLSL
jgi:hypothetical protein